MLHVRVMYDSVMNYFGLDEVPDWVKTSVRNAIEKHPNEHFFSDKTMTQLSQFVSRVVREFVEEQTGSSYPISCVFRRKASYADISLVFAVYVGTTPNVKNSSIH